MHLLISKGKSHPQEYCLGTNFFHDARTCLEKSGRVEMKVENGKKEKKNE